MKVAAASSTSLVVIPGRTSSLTRSRISLAVRHAWRIFSTSFALLIGIMRALCPQSGARYRRILLRDRDCHQSGARSISCHKGGERLGLGFEFGESLL